MPSVATLTRLSQAANPKQALLKEVGDVSNVSLLSGRVLVALYIGPEKTKGGIYRPTSQLKEDVYQSCVGLVIRKGAIAFKDDEQHKFHGQDVAVGDWVTFRPGDGKRIQIRSVDCRIIEDVLIDMVIDDPEIITHS